MRHRPVWSATACPVPLPAPMIVWLSALLVAAALAWPPTAAAQSVPPAPEIGADDANVAEATPGMDPRVAVTATIVGGALAIAVIAPALPWLFEVLAVGSPSVLCAVVPIC